MATHFCLPWRPGLGATAVTIPIPATCSQPRAPAHSRRRWNGVHAAIPGSPLPWLEGQTHNLAAEPAAAMAKEFFLGR
jgi:hypothetical protein